MRIYINNIAVENEGLLSNEVIKSIQSLGIGTIIKKNDESLLLTNPQRSIFEYFSTPNNVEFHPVLEDKFKGKIEQVKTFNKITINIEELRSKLDYISFYASRNPNSMCFLTVENDTLSFCKSKTKATSFWVILPRKSPWAKAKGLKSYMK
jgi:hypothetical protein